jgi:ADP-ribose pyrophosphatase
MRERKSLDQLAEKTIATTEIFNGRIIKVRVDTVGLPDGRQSTREIVEHRGAVAMIALTQSGEIVMVKQYRKPLERVTLEIPAGTLEPGEEPLVCAQRELIEETGRSAENWKQIFAYYSAPGFCTEKLYLFLAKNLKASVQQLDADENIQVVTLPLNKALQMVINGEIIDGKSIIGILSAVYLNL